jgi:proline utilization trans-activator
LPDVDGTAYDLASIYPRPKIVPDTSSLPSLDYSLYLTNTVKFHLGQMSHLFDEESFMQNLHRFYENEVDTAGLWYLQFLLVISFGKAFLVRTEAIAGMPIPGSEYFIRAMKMMPDVMDLHQDPILAIEILCLVSLYFHCADLLNVAYNYVSQRSKVETLTVLWSKFDKFADWTGSAHGDITGPA